MPEGTLRTSFVFRGWRGNYTDFRIVCRLLNTAKPHTTSSATYCISYGLLRASHSRNPTGKPDFVGLSRRSPHRITLRVYGCGSLPAYIRTFVPLTRHFVLIPVAFETAYSLLHTLRV